MSEAERGLRLLLITQELAADSSNMGVAHLWTNELAPLVERLHVIAATTGVVDLPHNVTVHALGKERGRGRLSRWPALLARCHRLIGGGRVDGVLAHMVPAYAIAAAPWCLVRRTPLVLWYTSHGRTRALRVGARLSSAAITASPESFPMKKAPAFVIGHGIDTDRLAAAPVRSAVSEPPVVGVAGRITPLKGLSTVVEAVAKMRDDGSPVELRIAGEPFYPADHEYFGGIQKRVRELELTDRVTYLGALPSAAMPDFYAGLDAFIAWRDRPALDKTGLEALAAGTLLVTNNVAYHSALGPFAGDFLVPSSAEALADGLRRALALHPGLRTSAIEQLRQAVLEEHAASSLAGRLVQVFRALCEGREPPFPRAAPAAKADERG
ncbi:MAG: glycosyltransferase family 4 protein [Chloroflexota bacterium]|nr:glycosyltransferase family 4 protein [Chloroflexota bacterium]